MTTATVEAGGVAIALEDRGAGPPAVFVHGTAASRSVWRETVDALGDDARSIVYDRRAYGESGEPEPYTGTTVGEQADDLAAVLEAIGVSDAIVVGHGLGALIGLDLLLRFSALARGAVLIEPPLLWLSPRGPEVVGDLRDAIERGARDGGPSGAVEAYLEHVAGADALDLYGTERAEAARGDTRAFAADLAAGPSWAASRREMRGITAPISIVTGWRSSPVWHEVSVALADLLPGAKLVELDTGHLAMLEQPDAVAGVVRQRLEAGRSTSG